MEFRREFLVNPLRYSFAVEVPYEACRGIGAC